MKPSNVSHEDWKGEARGRIRHMIKAKELERKKVPNEGELVLRT